MHLGRNLGRTTFVEMPHAPRISILTPTFGHAAVIGECIRSVQEQSFTDWEMIILDDGSKDGTYEAALRAGVGDARIHVYTQPNKGIFRLRENYDFMLEKASGEWLALLDGDDVWEKDKLALQWEALKSQPEAVACWGKAAVAGEDARTVLSVAPAEDHPQRHLFSNEPVGVLTGALYFDNCIPALTVLVRRSALECIGGFRQTHGQPLVGFAHFVGIGYGRTFCIYSSAAWYLAHLCSSSDENLSCGDHRRDAGSVSWSTMKDTTPRWTWRRLKNTTIGFSSLATRAMAATVW
jgi:glycosyltransferase involved in cell wall biosynthesis